MSDRIRIFRALLRTDFFYFVWKVFITLEGDNPFFENWAIKAIAYQLMRVEAGEITRLLVNLPPRSLKSIIVSIAYVAWRLGHNPSLRFMVLSYSTELAAELHRKFRVVVNAPWYQELFPQMRIAKDAETELGTSAGGGRLAMSIWGSVTGRGADVIIIDDPHKAEEVTSDSIRDSVIECYGTLATRPNNRKRGAIILVMQRLHEHDLAGHLIRQGLYYHLKLPAVAEEDTLIPVGAKKVYRRLRGEVLNPERESLEDIEKTREEVGRVKFAAQYQQRPVPAKHLCIQPEWFQVYDQLPPLGPNDLILQSWDVAMKRGERNDYSVCTTWLMACPNYYLIDVFRDRLTHPELRQKAIDLAAEYHAEIVLIEDAPAGISLLQDLRCNYSSVMPRIIPVKPEGGKVERLQEQLPIMQGGHVFLPKVAAWLSVLLEELTGSQPEHDDQIDSVSQALKWGSGRKIFPPRTEVGLPM